MSRPPSEAIGRVVSGRPCNAQERLYSENLALVGHVLTRQFPFLVSDVNDREDARIAGEIGLWRAARAYDSARGLAFSTLACKAIWHELCRFLREREMFHQRTLRAPQVSFSETPPGAEDVTYEEAIPDPASLGDPDVLIRADVGELLACLDPRDRWVLWKRCGEEYDGADIAEALGVSRQRVHQIQSKAMAKVRKCAEIIPRGMLTEVE